MAVEDDVGTKTGALTLSGVTVETVLAGFDDVAGGWIRTVDLLSGLGWDDGLMPTSWLNSQPLSSNLQNPWIITLRHNRLALTLAFGLEAGLLTVSVCEEVEAAASGATMGIAEGD